MLDQPITDKDRQASRCSDSVTVEVIEDVDEYDDDGEMTVRGSQLDGKNRREEQTVSRFSEGDLSATQENIPEHKIDQSHENIVVEDVFL